MWRTVLIYGAGLAAGAFGLQWLQYRVLVHAHPMGAYLAIFAVACMSMRRFPVNDSHSAFVSVIRVRLLMTGEFTNGGWKGGCE